MRGSRRPCEATTKSGRACTQHAVLEERYCKAHLPQDHPRALQRWASSVHGSHGESTSETATKIARAVVGDTSHLTPRDAHDLTRETVRQVQELAAERVGAVFAVWDEILADPLENGGTRASLGNMILDRAAGKPGQHHEISVGVAEWLAAPTDATDDDDVIDAA